MLPQILLLFYIAHVAIICLNKKCRTSHGKNNFIVVFTNLIRYESENDFMLDDQNYYVKHSSMMTLLQKIVTF